MLSKTSRRGGDVRTDQSATAREGVPWDAGQNVFGMIVDEEFAGDESTT